MSLRALVVGGTSGIGHGIALALAQQNYEVILAGRSEERAKAIMEQMKGNTHSFQAVNAFDLDCVKKLADNNVDVLVFTQGMATLQGYTPTTKDGLDEKLQLHYFSRLYLARLMAPNMKEGSRILTVLSAGVHNKYKHFDSDFELKKHYSIQNAADAAGFYTDAGFEALSNKYPNICVAHACPGFVNTNWGTEMPWMVRTMLRPLQSAFGRTLESCGETLTASLLKLENGFHLINENGGIIEKSRGLKHTTEERDVIWQRTLEVLPDICES